jgi:carbamoylphosphate synthase small subunit
MRGVRDSRRVAGLELACDDVCFETIAGRRAPGPHDVGYLFDRFVKLLDRKA